MDYERLLQGIAWTQQEWGQRKTADEPKCQKDVSYSALRGRGDNYWLHLESMNANNLEEEIVDCFLNTQRWYSHLDPPGTLGRQSMVCNLKKAVDELPDYYASLNSLRIEDIDFEGNVVLKGKETPILSVIDCIYSIFRQVKNRFAAVAASKLMNMALPNLFIMWDRPILKGYHVPRQDLEGFGKRAWSYTAFLILMQENMRHVKETYPGGSSLTSQKFVDQINAQCGYKALPITRLLDIANYAVAHPEKGAPNIKCNRCMQVTNNRLNEFTWSRKNKVGQF